MSRRTAGRGSRKLLEHLQARRLLGAGRPLPGPEPTSYFRAPGETAAAGPSPDLQGPPPARLPTARVPHRAIRPSGPGVSRHSMEDDEGPEYGKADFVLLDQVTMEDFMKNLQLR